MWQKLTAGFYGIALVTGGCLLLLQGGQMLSAAMLAQPTDSVKERIGSGEKVPLAELDRAITALDLAQTRYARPIHKTDQALFELVRYEQHKLGGREAAATLARARRDLDTALKQDPLNPYAWARLAYVFTLSPGPSIASVNALKRSFLTGPLDRNLALTRYELSLANWKVMDEPTRAMMEREVLLIWRGAFGRGYGRDPNRRRLISSALAYNKTGWLKALVATTPKDKLHFDAMLKQEYQRDHLQITIDADESNRGGQRP